MPPALQNREVQRVKGQQSRRIQEEVPEVLSCIVNILQLEFVMYEDRTHNLNKQKKFL